MKHWKVLFVKPRTEKKVAEYCKLYGIDFYLPMRENTRVVQRRKISVIVPLFSGYVFVRLLPTQKLQLQQTNLLVRILEPSNPRKMLRDLIMVRRALRADPALAPAKPLTKGRLVRIISGPFAGIEGRVARLTAKMKIVLNIEMIGQATAVEIESDLVEVLD
jgi:transcriptional antiterminator RfaH